MEKMRIKKGKLLEAIKNIPTFAEKEKWVLTLDKEEGTLFYSPKSIPDGAELHQVTDEYALYLDKNNNPKGVMVEYYAVNFLKHHNEIKDLSSEIFKSNKKINIVDPSKRNKEAKFFQAILEHTFLTEGDTEMLPA